MNFLGLLKWMIFIFIFFLLFKDLYQLQKIGFEVIFLCCAWAELECPGLWWWHGALACAYTGLEASGFGVIRDWGADFWVYLCWMFSPWFLFPLWSFGLSSWGSARLVGCLRWCYFNITWPLEFWVLTLPLGSLELVWPPGNQAELWTRKQYPWDGV